MPKEITRLNLNLDKEVHTKLKVYAALNHRTISSLITEAVMEIIKKAEAEKHDKP